MAVQAQYPTNAFSPDFRNRSLDDVQMMQDPRYLLQLHGGGIGGLGKQEHQILNTGVGFTGRQSELTCNASGSRKRAREDSMTLPSLHNPALSPLIPITGVLLQSRSLESGATSTSGRHVPSSQAVSPPVRDLVSLLLQQNLEIDALVRVQSEGLRIGLEEARKRHCRTLLSMLEQLAAKRLMEKEAELETASRRNAELEEKVRQLSEENQMWFTMAKNNEEIACGLRTSLEQALLQGAPAAAGHERFGDGDGDGAAFPADDAQSCCFEVEERRKACKACGERDVCVLLLPCRHVCVCKECESKADTCPVCGSTKNAYLQVFMC